MPRDEEEVEKVGQRGAVSRQRIAEDHAVKPHLEIDPEEPAESDPEHQPVQQRDDQSEDGVADPLDKPVGPLHDQQSGIMEQQGGNDDGREFQDIFVIGENTVEGAGKEQLGQSEEQEKAAADMVEKRPTQAEPTVPAREPNAKEKTKEVPDEVLQSLSPIQKAVLEAMPDDVPVTAETIKTEYPFGEVLAALTVLEISGIVRKLPGSMYGKA